MKVQRKIDVDALMRWVLLPLSHNPEPAASARTPCGCRFLEPKSTFTEDRELDLVSQIVKLSWKEAADLQEWGGEGPVISVEFDPDNGFLLFLTVAYNRRLAAKGRALKAEQLRASVFKQLDAAAVFTDAQQENKPAGIVAM